MSYKANRHTVGSKDNRQAYLEEHPCCELCKSTFLLACHHHIPQQYSVCGEVFILDIPDNYTALCGVCHGDMEKELNTLKSGDNPDEIILSWIDVQERDYFYETRLAKVREVLLYRLGRE